MTRIFFTTTSWNIYYLMVEAYHTIPT